MNIQELTESFVKLYRQKLTNNGISDIALQVALIKILTETAEEWLSIYKTRGKL